MPCVVEIVEDLWNVSDVERTKLFKDHPIALDTFVNHGRILEDWKDFGGSLPLSCLSASQLVVEIAG